MALSKDDLRREELRKMAEELEAKLHNEDPDPCGFGPNTFPTIEHMKGHMVDAIEAFGIACMKAGMEEAAKTIEPATIVGVLQSGKREEIPVGKRLAEMILQRAKEIEENK